MFRKESIDSQKKLAGDVSLAQPFSMYFSISTIIFSMIFIVLFLTTSSYSRKETVKGYLVPDRGVIKVYTTKVGVIEKVYVKDGEKVNKGDVLADLVLFRPQLNGLDLSESVLLSLKRQYNFLEQDLIETKKMTSRELEGLIQKRADIELSIKSVEKQMKLLARKYAIQSSDYDRYDKLSKREFLSKIDLKNKEKELLSVQESIESANAKKLSLISQYNETNLKISLKPNKSELRFTEILRKQEDIKLKLDEAKNNYTFSIVARESGVVTSISSKQGELLPISRSLLSIIPDGSVLIAELYLPTRSAGFVALNDNTRLRFDAFPYQRFGFIESKIEKIDKSLISDGDFDIPIKLSEPVYRVQASLSSQSIKAYGELFPLKAGMLFEADIILENRSLMQFLLDPIYSLRGRLG